jgi:hypothetical protein
MANEGADLAKQSPKSVPDTISSTSGGSYSSVSYNLTSKEDARASFRKAMTELYGFYDPKAFSVFYSQLQKLEKGYASRESGSGGSSTRTTTSFNPNLFMEEYLQGLAPAVIQSGKFGGAARQTVDELSSYADGMGLNYGASVFAKDMQSIISGNKTIDEVFNSYRESAAQLYSGFADRLRQNPKLTLKDLASPYINTMASLLEVDPNTISVTNPVLQGAIAKVDGTIKPVSEFIKDVKNMDAWKFTKNAKEEAVDLASSFKRAFGFGA